MFSPARTCGGAVKCSRIASPATVISQPNGSISSSSGFSYTSSKRYVPSGIAAMPARIFRSA